MRKLTTVCTANPIITKGSNQVFYGSFICKNGILRKENIYICLRTQLHPPLTCASMIEVSTVNRPNSYVHPLDFIRIGTPLSRIDQENRKIKERLFLYHAEETKKLIVGAINRYDNLYIQLICPFSSQYNLSSLK